MSYLNDEADALLLYQTQQIRQLEQWGIDNAHLSESQMMARAGQAAFKVVQQRYPRAQSMAVFCGGGNNGGDGFVVAHLAHQAGLDVCCYLMSDVGSIKPGPAVAAYEQCVQAGIQMQAFAANVSLQSIDLVVDAMLGIGLKNDVNAHYQAAIDLINHALRPVLALDCPSGLDVDTGRIKGAAIKADTTVTFIGAKFGLYTSQGVAQAGDVVVANLDFPADKAQAVAAIARRLSNTEIRPLLPKRCRASHKGNYGHVLVIGGDYGMGGAVRMAAEAALRSGAGLVTVATRPEHVTVVSATRPEIMCREIVDSDDVLPLLERANAIVCGPGLGQAEWSTGLFERVMQSEKPKVMDADCLNILSTRPQQHDQWILTPHPGEASRLLGIECASVQANRLQSVQQLQQRYGGVAVLKGAGTLIQAPDAMTELCSAGNPGMATAGMGDILSGILGGLLAQGLRLNDAAKAGVWAHAHAADCAAIAGGERGMLATDVLNYLREVVNPV